MQQTPAHHYRTVGVIILYINQVFQGTFSLMSEGAESPQSDQNKTKTPEGKRHQPLLTGNMKVRDSQPLLISTLTQTADR